MVATIKNACKARSGQTELNTSTRRFLLFTLGFTMFSAIVYEVVWTRSLSLVFGTTVYALSAVLAAFLTGLALGALLMGRIADTTKRPMRLLSRLQFAIGCAAVVLLPVFTLLRYPYVALHNALGQTFGLALILFVLTFLMLLIPTGAVGAAFTLVSKIYTRHVGEDIAEVYAVDTLFGGLGGFVAGFFLIPSVGLVLTTLFAAGLNISLGLMISRRSRR